MMYVVDQSKHLNFAITNSIFLKIDYLIKTCIFIKRTCLSIFSKFEFVDQSKPCTQIYLHIIASYINLQLPIIIFKNQLCQTYIIVKCTCISIFSKIGLVERSKPCTQIYLQKNCKLHKFETINSKFAKIYSFKHASS